MLKFLLALVFLILSVNAQTITKFRYTLCNGPNAATTVTSVDMTPMPIVHPGNVNLLVNGASKRVISGKLKTVLNIIRTVAGLPLPVRCTIVSGLSVGSCTYDDGCKDLLQDLAEITPANCPQDLIDLGSDCSCPLNNIPAQTINKIFEVSLDDLSASPVSFLASGDFDVSITASDATGEVLCIRVYFAVKKA